MLEISLSDVGSIKVLLRQGLVASRKSGELILDLSRRGHWIRGFEMIGGMVDFSLKRAVHPFSPSMPTLGSTPTHFSVTFDDEADAAYFYLNYGKAYGLLPEKEKLRITEYSHSVSPSAACELDVDGGLLGVEFSVVDSVKSPEEFLYLFDVKKELDSSTRL